MLGKTICAAKGADVSDLDAAGHRGVSEEKITLLRPDDIDECFKLAQSGAAAAVFVNEFKVRAALTGLGLGNAFEVLERLVSIADLHFTSAKSNPNA